MKVVIKAQKKLPASISHRPRKIKLTG